MGREPLARRRKAFLGTPLGTPTSCGISPHFWGLSPTARQVAHVLLTRPPLTGTRGHRPARLACVRHAASVYPEPGSNSPNILPRRPFSRSPRHCPRRARSTNPRSPERPRGPSLSHHHLCDCKGAPRPRPPKDQKGSPGTPEAPPSGTHKYTNHHHSPSR